jgi:hypothetical protein
MVDIRDVGYGSRRRTTILSCSLRNAIHDSPQEGDSLRLSFRSMYSPLIPVARRSISSESLLSVDRCSHRHPRYSSSGFNSRIPVLSHLFFFQASSLDLSLITLPQDSNLPKSTRFFCQFSLSFGILARIGLCNVGTLLPERGVKGY